MSKRNWYSIKNAENSNPPELYIFDEIGFWGITARDLVRDLREMGLKKGDPLTLRISSPGGSVFDGIAIKNVLAEYDVTTYIDGIAASIASVIALAGKTIQIAEDAFVMIHNPAGVAFGESEDMRKYADMLDKITDTIAGDYAERMGIGIDDAKQLMSEETWMTGKEAVEMGYADSTYPALKVAASFGAATLRNAPASVKRRFAISPESPGKQITNTMANEKKNTPGEEVTFTESELLARIESARKEEQDKAVAVRSAELARQSGIAAIAAKHGLEKQALAAIAEGKSVADFQAEALEVLGQTVADLRKNTPDTPVAFTPDAKSVKTVKLADFQALSVYEQNRMIAGGYTIVD